MRTLRFTRRAARVNLIVLLSAIGALVVVVLLFFLPASPQTAGTAFMDALARQDSKKLADLSFVQGKEVAEVQKDWEALLNGPAKYYRFYWNHSQTVQSGADIAAVRFQVTRDVDSGMSYEEKFELPMVKKNGAWKVDVRRVDRRMFPFLPR